MTWRVLSKRDQAQALGGRTQALGITTVVPGASGVLEAFASSHQTLPRTEDGPSERSAEGWLPRADDDSLVETSVTEVIARSPLTGGAGRTQALRGDASLAQRTTSNMSTLRSRDIDNPDDEIMSLIECLGGDSRAYARERRQRLNAVISEIYSPPHYLFSSGQRLDGLGETRHH